MDGLQMMSMFLECLDQKEDVGHADDGEQEDAPVGAGIMILSVSGVHCNDNVKLTLEVSYSTLSNSLNIFNAIACS